MISLIILLILENKRHMLTNIFDIKFFLYHDRGKSRGLLLCNKHLKPLFSIQRKKSRVAKFNFSKKHSKADFFSASKLIKLNRLCGLIRFSSSETRAYKTVVSKYGFSIHPIGHGNRDHKTSSKRGRLKRFTT